MKRIFSFRTYLLLVVIGLFASLSLSAQQYHDAAAFGLKGHVRRCEVFAEDGTVALDPHLFDYVGFADDGRLAYWHYGNLATDYPNWEYGIRDIVRSDGALAGFSINAPSAQYSYHFRYKDGRLSGAYVLGYDEDTWLPIWDEYKTRVVVWIESELFPDVMMEESVTYKDMSDEITTLVEEEFKKRDSNAEIPYMVYSSLPKEDAIPVEVVNYEVKERDSHGNYTVLVDKNSGASIKRILTYWDESPEGPRQNSSTSASVASYLKVDGAMATKTVNFTSSGGRQYYSVDTSASDFETWGVPSWCSVEKSSSGFTLVCGSNPTSSPRSDYMKVKADGHEIRIDISQSGSAPSYSSASSRSSSRSTSRYGGGRTRSYSKPWFTIGIDGSLDYMIGNSETVTMYYDPYYGDYYTDYTEGEDRMA